MSNDLSAIVAKCDREIARLREELAIEERVRERVIERMTEEATPKTASAHAHRVRIIEKGGRRPAGAIVAGSLMQRISTVLKEAGRPMRAPEIAKIVATSGFVTKGKGGLPFAVSSALAHARGRLFERTGPGLYQLVGEKKDLQTEAAGES